MNASQSGAAENCSKETVEEWKNVVSELNTKLAKQSM